MAAKQPAPLTLLCPTFIEVVEMIRKMLLKGWEERLANAFSRVRGDIQNMERWVRHLYDSLAKMEKQHAEHATLTRKDIASINHWLHYMHSHAQQVMKLISEQTQRSAHAQSILERMRQKMAELERENSVLKEEIRKINEKMAKFGTGSELVQSESRTEPKSEPAKQEKISGFEREVIEKVRKHKKDFVKQQILYLVSKQPLSTKELERFIVENKGYCGRTTFYTYLKEMKENKEITPKEEAGTSIWRIPKP